MSQMSKHPTMTLESALCILCPDEKMVVCIIDEQKKKFWIVSKHKISGKNEFSIIS